MIGKQSRKLSELQSEASSAQQELALLRQQVEHQNLLMQSMWRLVENKLGLNDKILEKTLRAIKEEKANMPDVAENCPNCSRPLQDNSPICIYCGAETGREHLF